MHITFCCTGTRAAPWIEAFAAAMPEATVTEWAPGAPPADHAVVWAPSQQFLDEQAQLRGIFNIGAGVDGLMRLRLPAGVPVVRLDDGGMAVQMAEFVTHAVVRHFRELDGYEADMAAGKWSYRKPQDRADFPVGILGLGVLGQRVAQALQVFEFPVRGWSRSPRSVEGVECFSGTDGLSAFLAGTRVLVCLLPLTADTQDILNRTTLSQLLPGGYLINVARGGHLVENDLLALLDEGHLAGAALDVFRTEPLPAGHPFWGDSRIAITPHTSARTLRPQTVAQIVGKIRALEQGQPIAGIVDPARGY
jgi:glyoxylate/hydroxypyruvate reductase A